MKKKPVQAPRVGTGSEDQPFSGLPSRDDVAGLAARTARAEKRNTPVAVSRRSVLKLLSASAVLAMGGPGCNRKPFRPIISMAETPEYQHPGEALYYASTWTEGQIPYGIMIKTMDGRPVKIEGLPDHPLNQGASSAQMQASILSLYDPDRMRGPRKGANEITWAEADQEIVQALKGAKSIVLITRSLLAPSERAIINRFTEACAGAQHLVYEAVHDQPRRTAWKGIYGTDGEVRPVLSKAKMILSIDADFLGMDGDTLTAIREFAKTRVLDPADLKAESLSRLYVAESTMTVTGSNADHRIPLRPSATLEFVRALRAALKGDEGACKAFGTRHGLNQQVLRALVDDLKSHTGTSVALAGSHLPGAVHAAVALLNDEIGAPGNTLEWNPFPAALPVNHPAEIEAALANGPDALILMGVNPVHDWPGGGFEQILKQTGLSVGHGLYLDETLAACTLALPSSHNLESWNDAAPLPGMHGICQPVIAPLFNSRQEAESLLAWTKALVPGDSELERCKDWHDFVKVQRKKDFEPSGTNPEKGWADALRAGLTGKKASLPFPSLNKAVAEAVAAKDGLAASPVELILLPHHAFFDGRFAGIGWLQEFPDPVTKLVWDNAAMIGPAAAAKLGVEEGDWIRIELDTGVTMDLPVLIQPGTAAGVVAATLGCGRSRAGRVGTNRGFNTAMLLRKGQGPDSSPRLSGVTRILTAKDGGKSGKYELVRIQKYFSMMGRPIVLDGTKEEYVRNPGFVKERQHVPPLKQIDPDWDYSKGHKWAMAIDLSACVGCGTCMIACQAENNIPIVGKEECALGREMHWIRLDRYHGGDGENPTVYQQPMLCQHCDNAPCESVCPVNATAHGPEGLNQQVYNRCVGTRYCANNCPYKVRRFNFYNYTKENLHDSVQELLYNPQVTVRSRGVMEKCTFCVQRINEVKFKMKNEGKEIPDDAIQPACRQACPAGAIVFGDLNDPGSRIAAVKKSNLAYFVLEELNIRPNVSYLARVRNPHPGVKGHDDGGHG